jgi:RNA polymerase sigma factor (sigma-70 family)
MRLNEKHKTEILIKESNKSMPTDDENKSICQRIRSGDELAISEFLTKYEEQILRTLRIQLRRTNSKRNSHAAYRSTTSTDVNSLLNESLAKLIEYVRNHELERTDERLLLTLYKISKNLLIDRNRRNAVSPLVPMDPTMDPSTDEDRPGDQLEIDETIQGLMSHVSALPESKQELFNLRVSGNSFVEIGKKLNKRHDALRAEFSRIIKLIRDKMAE